MKKRLLVVLVCTGTITMWGQFPRSVVDRDVADRGAKLYASQCARCHGEDVRGTAAGPDLIRSVAVLHDRRQKLMGKELEPLMAKEPHHKFHYSEKELAEISQFLTASVNSILRSGYNAEPTNLLTGDVKAGEAYFNGAGGCAKCHSVSGDLAGIGGGYKPATLQQKLLFPNYGLGVAKKTQVSVTLPSGKVYTGDLVRMDDFAVSLKDPSGEYRSFNRTVGTKVTSVNPFDAHFELLDKYTDADIHNLTTYMATLK